MSDFLHQAMIDDMTEPEPHPQFEQVKGGFIESAEPAMIHKPESMIQRPDVSVLIPAYNCALTLKRAVESALFQEGVSVQVVIVDDKSTDGTLKLAYELATIHEPSLDKLITVHPRYENGRIAATLNTAAATALGRYFIRLDSDDWYEQGCLSKFVAALDANPNAMFVYGARKYWGRRSDIYRPQPFSREAFNLHNAAGYCYMFRRQVWDEGLRWRALGTFGGAVIDLEDWQHLQAMLAKGYAGLALPSVLALHYAFRWDGTWQELQANQAEALAEFKRLWPNVQAASL